MTPTETKNGATGDRCGPEDLRQVILLSQITREEGVQLRDGLDESTIKGLVQFLKEGGQPGHAVVFEQDGRFILADGHHYFEAASRVGLKDIVATIRQGSVRDATLFGLQVNAHHGRPLSVKEKAKAVEWLLSDPEWSRWADAEIARQCGVSGRTVGRHRKSLKDAAAAEPAHADNVKDDDVRKFRRKDATVGTKRVQKIGKGPRRRKADGPDASTMIEATTALEQEVLQRAEDAPTPDDDPMTIGSVRPHPAIAPEGCGQDPGGLVRGDRRTPPELHEGRMMGLSAASPAYVASKASKSVPRRQTAEVVDALIEAVVHAQSLSDQQLSDCSRIKLTALVDAIRRLGEQLHRAALMCGSEDQGTKERQKNGN